MTPILELRAERSLDAIAIRQVNIAAFGRENEANLVDRLRKIVPNYSFVALEAGEIVGHIFFTPVTIDGRCDRDIFILGLAPLAVMPSHQHRGIGSQLARYGLEQCASLNCQAIFVLGSPGYYSRFGFIPARSKGFRCEYNVPSEAFMVLELASNALENCSGIVKYRSEFNECE